MDYKKYQYLVLCEDKAHYHFVRGWLEGQGARRSTNVGELPHEGSGKAFVEKHFQETLEKVRGLSKMVRTFLVVVIDADNLTCEAIAQKLKYDPQDPVFLLIPKWSLDTWARFFMEPDHGQALDESESCKNEIRQKAKWAKLGRKLSAINLADLKDMPDSLRYSYDAIKRKKEQLKLN